MRIEIRCKKCRKLLFVLTSEKADITGIECKCTRCKEINIYLNSQVDALTPQ